MCLVMCGLEEPTDTVCCEGSRDYSRHCRYSATRRFSHRFKHACGASAEGACLVGGGARGRWRGGVVGRAQRGGPLLPSPSGVQPACGARPALRKPVPIVAALAGLHAPGSQRVPCTPQAWCLCSRKSSGLFVSGSQLARRAVLRASPAAFVSGSAGSSLCSRPMCVCLMCVSSWLPLCRFLTYGCSATTCSVLCPGRAEVLCLVVLGFVGHARRWATVAQHIV